MEPQIKMFFMACFIFLSRICDVSFMSIRTIFLTKGMSKLAALLGFFEVTIYITVLGKVVNSLDNPLYLFAYAFGYACGNYIGSKIENFIAFGEAQMRIILSENDNNVIDELRDLGFGVTVFDGQGKNGAKHMLLINLKRKRIQEVYDYLKLKNINAFVSTNDITSTLGGYSTPGKKIINRLKK